jgi:hypothetical protein
MMNGEKPFWQRTKFLAVVLGTLAVLGVVLAAVPLGINEDQQRMAVDAIKWFAGFFLGTHTASDVGHMIATRGGARLQGNPPPPPPVEEDDEGPPEPPDGDDDDAE